LDRIPPWATGETCGTAGQSKRFKALSAGIDSTAACGVFKGTIIPFRHNIVGMGNVGFSEKPRGKPARFLE
jgi:hypothetical protein